MKIVITGATGMIGLALIELLKDKHDLILILRPNSKNNKKPRIRLRGFHLL